MSLELRSLLPYPNSCRGTNPHQRERDTKMAMLSFGGIDVSKDRLDVVVLPEEECSSVPNDAAGWAELVERLRGFSITAIGIEPSGGYERGAMRALLAAGMPVRQVNPFKLRQFARAFPPAARATSSHARWLNGCKSGSASHSSSTTAPGPAAPSALRRIVCGEAGDHLPLLPVFSGRGGLPRKNRPRGKNPRGPPAPSAPGRGSLLFGGPSRGARD